jgi:hypothetical protein
MKLPNKTKQQITSLHWQTKYGNGRLKISRPILWGRSLNLLIGGMP